MNRFRTYYSSGHRAASVLMMIALLWLTVSLPFVYAAQEGAKQVAAKSLAQATDEEDSGNPLAGTTEEKTETGVNTLSEYLHEIHIHDFHPVVIVRYEKCHADDLYFAFHPELLCPPPEARA